MVTFVEDRPFHELPDGRLVPLLPLPPEGLLEKRVPGVESLEIRPGQLPLSMDLSGEMTPVRFQGARPTCVAFAMTAALEFIHRADLSEQYAYWAAEMADGNSHDGLYLVQAAPLMQSTGTVTESTWPYAGYTIPSNPAQDPPPPAAGNAQKYRFGRVGLEAGSNARQPALIAIGMAQRRQPAMFTFGIPPQGLPNDGNLVVPPGSPDPVAGHGVLICGYDANRGTFKFKNSWDITWGMAGYGVMTQDFIMRYGFELGMGLP